MVFIGVLTGFIGTLFGLGGGVVMVPFLSIVYNYNIHIAITTSLLCILFRSLFSVILFLQENKINIPLGLALACSAIIGSFFGAQISLVIYAVVIKILFACSALLLSLLMLYVSQPKLSTKNNSFFFHAYTEKQAFPIPRKDALSSNDRTSVIPIQYVPIRIVRSVCAASIAGFLGGLLGLGGGSVLIPIMVLLCHVPVKIAVATSSFIISFSTVPALLVYTQSIDIDILTTVVLVIGAYIGTYIGKVVLSIVKNKQLSLLFFIINSIIAASMVYDALRN